MTIEILEETIEAPWPILSKDLKAGVATMKPQEARYLVDLYYQLQEHRIRSGNQIRAMATEPHAVIHWAFQYQEKLEGQVKAALGAWSLQSPVGRWADSIHGIGPVINAGLLAHIDITQAPTVGHIWRFAGLDPTQRWVGAEEAKTLVRAVMQDAKAVTPEHIAVLETRLNRSTGSLERAMRFLQREALAKEKPLSVTPTALANAVAVRPWNAQLKTLCWKLAESFVKTCNSPKSFYGPLYQEYKARIARTNAEGGYAERAKAALLAKNYGKDTEAYKAYSQGFLPDGHIHAMAERWTSKLFLAHFHHVAYESRYGIAPPKPYVLNMPGHTHEINVPNWPMARWYESTTRRERSHTQGEHHSR